MGVEFGEFSDEYSEFRKALKDRRLPHSEDDIREFVERYGTLHSAVQYGNERRWREAGRPYYKVWPAIRDAFPTMDLSRLSAADTILGVGDFGPMELRFPKESWSVDGGSDAAFVLAGKSTVSAEYLGFSSNPELSRSFGSHDGASVGIMFAHGESYASVRIDGTDRTLEDQIEYVLDAKWRLPRGPKRDAWAGLIKCSLLVAMIPSDDSIIDRDVLARDADRYSVTLDPRLVEKAIAKGKNGWNVGRNVENVPHYRRPHPALYWTGKGGKIPKIVFRSGALVHRGKVAKVPTGYRDAPLVTAEPNGELQ